jgi:hypothetical protein
VSAALIGLPMGGTAKKTRKYLLCLYRTGNNDAAYLFHMPDTKTARIQLSSIGVLTVRINEGATQSLADAQENLAIAVSETGGIRRPLLIDIRRALPVDAAARHHYSGQTLAEAFSALALLVEASPFGRMMGNVYLRIAQPGIPTRLFTDEAQAMEWLNGHRSRGYEPAR